MTRHSKVRVLRGLEKKLIKTFIITFAPILKEARYTYILLTIASFKNVNVSKFKIKTGDFCFT